MIRFTLPANGVVSSVATLLSLMECRLLLTGRLILGRVFPPCDVIVLLVQHFDLRSQTQIPLSQIHRTLHAKFDHFIEHFCRLAVVLRQRAFGAFQVYGN